MKKDLPCVSPLWLLLILILVVTACDKESQGKGKQKAADSLTELQLATMTGELFPLATGDAYLVASNIIYYVSNGEAVRVKGQSPSLSIPEVRPLSDGRAILIDSYSNPPVIYHLRQDVAVIVVEKAGPTIGKTQPPNPNGLHFVESQRLLRELKSAQETPDHGDDSGVPRESQIGG